MSLQKNFLKPDDWHAYTFSQKVAWRCHNPDPNVDYRTWVDKYLVKQLVSPLFKVAKPYLVVEEVLDINTRNLPETFVMKATHGWNMCLLVVDNIVQGGNRSLDGAGKKCRSEYLQQTAHAWLDSEFEKWRRANQKHYQLVPLGILFEQFLKPVDYEVQLFLFNGKCRIAMTSYRDFYHSGGTHRIYDEQWQRLEPASEKAKSCYEWTAEDTPPPPSDLMQKLETLCRSIDHVRADFYVSNGQYYFSEFTFTHNAGKGPGFIGEHNARLGRFWLD